MAMMDDTPGREKLTLKQSRFVDEYLKDLNQRAAAIRAGYGKNRASRTGYDLLQNPKVLEVVKRRIKELKKESDITQTRVLAEERAISFFDPAEIFDDNGEIFAPFELPENVRRAIKTITVVEVSKNKKKYTYRFYDKDKSLERIGKHLGMYKDAVFQFSDNKPFDVKLIYTDTTDTTEEKE